MSKILRTVERYGEVLVVSALMLALLVVCVSGSVAVIMSAMNECPEQTTQHER